MPILTYAGESVLRALCVHEINSYETRNRLQNPALILFVSKFMCARARSSCVFDLLLDCWLRRRRYVFITATAKKVSERMRNHNSLQYLVGGVVVDRNRAEPIEKTSMRLGA